MPEYTIEYIRNMVTRGILLGPEAGQALLDEIERLEIEKSNIQAAIVEEGHKENCAIVHGASFDCSCGKNDAMSFHPRAWKLMLKQKNFLVVAEDEPYFPHVYGIIRVYEKINGTWTDQDERFFKAAVSKAEMQS
jgi:hypothetical protein